MAAHLLGRNLKVLRKETRKTQTDIGLQVNKAYQNIGNWETGLNEPSLDDTIKIASYFGILVDDLLLLNINNGGDYAKSKERKLRWVGGDYGGDYGGFSTRKTLESANILNDEGAPGTECKKCQNLQLIITEKTATIAALQDTIKVLKDSNATLNSLIQEMGKDDADTSKHSATG